MFTVDRAPGVYYQAVDASTPPVTPLRTDIAGFVGIAERGPIDVPVPIESWQQFLSWFGGVVAEGYLGYAVRGFLENGGRRCWVVRVASRDPVRGARVSETTVRAPATVDHPEGVPVWRIRASSEGLWGDELTVNLRERNRTQVHSRKHDPAGAWSEVPGVAGLSRLSLVRVTQAGSAFEQWRVVSETDPITGRLFWVNPQPARRLTHEAPLVGFDPDRPVLIQTVDYQMLVSERGRLLRMHDGLSLVPEHPGYGPSVLRALSPSTYSGGSPANASSPEPVVIERAPDSTSDLRGLVLDPSQHLRLGGGSRGLAALAVFDLIGEPSSDDDSDFAVTLKRRGLRRLEEVAEIGLLSVPDVHIQPVEVNPRAPAPTCVPDPCLDPVVPVVAPVIQEPPESPPVFSPRDVYRVQAEMIQQCESLRHRFALLDPPYDVVSDTESGIRGVLDWRARFETSYAALSYPWLLVADPVRPPGTVRPVPPSGHVAGLVAATDLRHGVHRAPANQPLGWVLGASVPVSEEHHALLNSQGVNAVRTVAGRGLRLLGARTLSADPDWRFLNVRRLMSMIEKALGSSLQWAVFEPNGFLTRARATMSVTFFLDSLQEAGMLGGRTDEESFFVQCDLDNNPAADRDLGRLLIEVGVAPSQPFEFVLLRVGRVTDSIEVRETVGSLGATGSGV